MKKTLILYWPEGGDTDCCAHKIFDTLTAEKATIHSLEEIEVSIVKDYDQIIVGGSTIGANNWKDAQKDNEWVHFLRKCREEQVNLEGKKVAIFGLGDQILYPNHFVDDMADIYHALVAFGAKVVGEWPAEAYRFSASKALINNKFLGLALDETNESEKSDERITKWLEMLQF
ncbi:MAG: flavodoxin [Bacteroidetes bacterium]|nr:MAG: flavodoxin [Bacteroidota bacterium]PIE88587.1 MAG: flavodoxin [Bacteroidota bacterium]